MIPLRDVIPSRSTPYITLTIIGLNVVAWLVEISLPRDVLPLFLQVYGVVPADFHTSTLISSMFLHGSWSHIVGNMWYLWIFGDNVEDRLGHFSYLVFYLLCGIGAGIVHTILNFNTVLPSVGASGAIAGVLGAYVVSYPGARILTLVPIFIFWQIIEIPAVVVLGLWFVMQFFSGTAALATTSASAGGVAWWAHIGGFIIGIILIGLFPRKDSPRYDYYSRV
jgi:membrane associated rhomboid family serine protease